LLCPQPPERASDDRPHETQPDLYDITGGNLKEETVSVVIYTVEEAAQVLKISRWKVFDLIRTNHLRSIKIGGLRRIPHIAIDEYIARLMEEAA
jgi:excisionase family DNA binding protein